MTEPYSAVVDEYCQRLLSVLPGDVVGIYLNRSIALGAYHDGKSDIDCTVLLSDSLDGHCVDLLRGMHCDIAHKYSGQHLECQYLPRAQLGKQADHIAPFYSYHDGVLSLGKFNAHDVTWYQLKMHGVILYGDGTSLQQIPTSIEDVKQYVIENVNTYWRSWRTQAGRIASKWGLATLRDGAVEWGVSGISRMHYTLAQDGIVSKDKALEYALLHTDHTHHRILMEAMRIRTGKGRKKYWNPVRRKRDMLRYIDTVITACNAACDAVTLTNHNTSNPR